VPGPTGPISPQYVSLRFSHSSLSPASAASYYIVDFNDLAPNLTSTTPVRAVVSTVTGQIERVTRQLAVAGAGNPTGETGTFNVRNLTTSTSSTVTTTAQWGDGTASGKVQHNSWNVSSPLIVNVGDLIVIEQISPTWVTTPTSMRQTFNVLIQKTV
jgi:hypothetical protein